MKISENAGKSEVLKKMLVRQINYDYETATRKPVEICNQGGSEQLCYTHIWTELYCLYSSETKFDDITIETS